MRWFFAENREYIRSTNGKGSLGKSAHILNTDEKKDPVKRRKMDCKERILSNNYADIITDYPIRYGTEAVQDYCYVNVDNLFNLVFVNRMELPPLPRNLFPYHNMPKIYGLMQLAQNDNGMSDPFDNNSLVVSGIAQVQREPLNLTGNGCVICIIDTGIRYTEEAFQDSFGRTRITAIWDQTIQEGPPPEGFLYGTEYTREDIERALQSENPYAVVPSRDENGHGTAMAGVAAGSRVNGGRNYLGAAPDAEIVVVKLKECKEYLREYYLIPEDVPAYSETDIMMAVQYADSFAIPFRRPVVICLGIGTNMGDHSGTSALSRYMEAVANRRSRAVVVCGGNEGNARHHFSGGLETGRSGTENFQEVEVRVGEDSRGFVMELWGRIPDTISVMVRSPGGESIPPIILDLPQSVSYNFIYERTEITISSVLVEQASGQELIFFRIQNPTPGIWTFRVFAVGEIHNGQFSVWLPITAFLDTEIHFLASDPYITLTEPAMASEIIAVSTYNDANNSFYIESGRGFAMDGSIRPDFAAPGVNIPTVVGRRTGSSLAAAITAGAVAQFMQWSVVEGNRLLVESTEIKNYFIRGASRSPNLSYPNREWGYGRLNVSGTFEALAGV